MATAVYEKGHPLYEYFQASGDDGTRSIPGGLDKVPELSEYERAQDLSLSSTLDAALAKGRLLFLPPPANGNKAFAERFKYIIISSPLLSSAVSPLPLDAPDPTPRRAASVDIASSSSYAPALRRRPFSLQHLVLPMPDSQWLVPLLGLMAFAPQRAAVVVVATAWIVNTFYSPKTIKGDGPNPYANPLNAMNDLISAIELWDVIVGKSLGALEDEEDQPISTPASENLRTALASAFESMHLEADNIRQLFSPLAAPLELSMLSEMYAPDAPSVSPAPSSHHFRGGSMSGFPSSSPSPSPLSSSAFSKRSTWNGAARHGSRQIFRPLSELDIDGPRRPASPPSPSIASFVSDAQDDTFGSSALSLMRGTRRRNGNARRDLDLVMSRDERPGSPLRHSSTRPSFAQFTSSSMTPLTSPGSPASASKYNPGRTSPRRPRSMSALKSSMDRALKSRRYAAAHLLALRFDDESNENEDTGAYWEDVGSVMGLFARGIRESAEGLGEVLEMYGDAKRKEGIPTPPPRQGLRSRRLSDERGDEEGEGVGIRDLFSIPLSPSPLSSPFHHQQSQSIRRLPSVELSSFAPMPSDLAKFASHMDLMARSIGSAQMELRTCLDALKSAPEPSENNNSAPEGEAEADADGASSSPDPTQLVLDAYARLRKELGAALRECERGKSPLSATLHVADQDGEEDKEENSDDTAQTSASAGTTAVAAPASSSPSGSQELLLESGIDSNPVPSNQLNLDVFDAFIDSKRMEEETGQRASPSSRPGSKGKNPFAQPDPEQVFEATIVSPVTMQLREKSKLSRAERIRAMRERRAAGGASVLSDIPGSSSDERSVGDKGGKKGSSSGGRPGGEVVQELRNVINLVSERRRGRNGVSTVGGGASSSSSLSLATSTGPSPLSRSSVPEGASPVVASDAQLFPTAVPSSSSRGTSPAPSFRSFRDDVDAGDIPVRPRTLSRKSSSANLAAALAASFMHPSSSQDADTLSASGSASSAPRSRTSSANSRVLKASRPAPPPPTQNISDGFDTDTFGHRSSSPSLPSSPSPPSSPKMQYFDMPAPATPSGSGSYRTALNSPAISLPPFPPSSPAPSSPSPASIPIPPSPSRGSSSSSIPSRVSALLTVAARPPRPARPNRLPPPPPSSSSPNVNAGSEKSPIFAT